MNKFKNKEADYEEWRESAKAGFVFNHFGGTNPNYNVLHKAFCVFLSRDKDKGSRTIVEKWCSTSEEELVQFADRNLGPDMWKQCGVCFRPSKISNSDSRKSARLHDGNRTGMPVKRGPQVSNSDLNCNDNSFWIPGEPAVWLGSGEEEWKRKVVTAMNKFVLDHSPQRIDVKFRFTEKGLFIKDIDNLLTPVLESARDSGWVARGFGNLGSVTAEKSVVQFESDKGALVTPFSMLPPSDTTLPGVLIETDVARLDADTVKWALYDRAFDMFTNSPELRFPPQTKVAMDIRVTVDNDQRRKSIQAIMKPCIDGVEPILGHPCNVLPVSRFELKRRLAPQDEMVMNVAFNVRGGSTNHVSVRISQIPGT